MKCESCRVDNNILNKKCIHCGKELYNSSKIKPIQKVKLLIEKMFVGYILKLQLFPYLVLLNIKKIFLL